ncbi:ATP-binding protein [Deinococcus roseus]|uniref:Histidine kinase n=1 Tax=Deinococcus roseus TaxID=392414 RepID=A0ABQ2DAU1_9DEIO|nr:ATP-binding protein [Deinococcus roseus]GGJ52065.1 histidine kinase [Deinococcus roseus]
MEPLNLPATLDALDPIADFVLEAAKAAGLEKKAAYRLRLAVDEIATNIVTHGYEEMGMTGDIQVYADMDEESLTITLEDTAVPYNPFEQDPVSEEELQKPLEERPIGGLGLFLTIRGVDRFSYERVANINRNMFLMLRPKEGAPDVQ